MRITLSMLAFLIVEISVVIFILSTTGVLPANVATHFSLAGIPNGYMAKSSYQVFILFFSAGLPALIVGSILLVLRYTPPERFNLPNRKIWLSPAYKTQTMRFFDSHTPWVGVMHGLFMAYIHWTLVSANSVQPAQLPAKDHFLGIGIFLAGIFLWIGLILLKFNRLPKA